MLQFIVLILHKYYSTFINEQSAVRGAADLVVGVGVGHHVVQVTLDQGGGQLIRPRARPGPRVAQLPRRRLQGPAGQTHT